MEQPRVARTTSQTVALPSVDTSGDAGVVQNINDNAQETVAKRAAFDLEHRAHDNLPTVTLLTGDGAGGFANAREHDLGRLAFDLALDHVRRRLDVLRKRHDGG